MKRSKTSWLLVGLLCLGLLPMVAPSAQETRWDSIMADAAKAYQQADYAQAKKLLLAALKEAEKFGEQDPRFATSLNNLAELYRAQGKYAQAEPLYRRALARAAATWVLVNSATGTFLPSRVEKRTRWPLSIFVWTL